jgi:hypothetical protein
MLRPFFYGRAAEITTLWALGFRPTGAARASVPTSKLRRVDALDVRSLALLPYSLRGDDCS